MKDVQLTSTHVVGVFNAGGTSGLTNPAQWLIDWVHGEDGNDAGVKVSPKRALGLPSILFCVNKISNDISQLPLNVYQKQEGKAKEIAYQHPAYKVLEKRPNEIMTPCVLRKLLQVHTLIRGNGRAAVIRNGRGEPTELIPLPPEYTVTVDVYDEDNPLKVEKWHVIRWPDGKTPTKLRNEDVLHIMALSMDGIQGLGLLDLAKNAVAEGLAGQKYTNRNFSNHGVPPMVLEAPVGSFRNEAEARKFLADFNEYHSGLDNAGKVGLLREGVKANVLGLKPHDAEVLEQRKFSRQEVMLIFGIESMPGDEDSVSYNSLEQKNRAYLTHCLGPWMRQWEQECERKLLTNQQQVTSSHYVRFDAYELVRPDAVSEAQMISALRKDALITANEGRDWLDLPPIDGGDTLFNPAITPGPPPSDPAETTDDPSETDAEDAAAELARRAVSASLRRLIKVEANRVKDAAAKAKNFTKAIEEFYGRWQSSFAVELCEIGGETWHAEQHVTESLACLLKVAENSTLDTLVANVETEVNKWPARADAMVNVIMQLEEIQ